ncbi:MAG TPA: hypothetical protein VFT38_17585 [Vicinamibacteria bacterium]|nr:hypothetical protein [Vicinamibacteria bacterium]
MTAFDRIVCEYPLSDPRDQDREFVTRDLGGWGRDRYVITRDGRLIRHASIRPQGLEPVKDVEWPVEGEIRMVDDDVTEAEDPVEYAVRFTGGQIDWIRRVRMEAGESAVPPSDASARGAMIPERMGRHASPEEFRSSIPRKLELVEGHIPGEQKLVMFLLTTMGLARVAALVGRESWLAAVAEKD